MRKIDTRMHSVWVNGMVNDVIHDLKGNAAVQGGKRDSTVQALAALNERIGELIEFEKYDPRKIADIKPKQNYKIEREIELESRVNSLQALEDGRILAGCSDGSIRIFNQGINSGGWSILDRIHRSPISRVQVLPQQKILFSGDARGAAIIDYDSDAPALETMELILKGNDIKEVQALNSRTIVGVGLTPNLILFEKEADGRWKKLELRSHTSKILCIGHFDDGRLVTGSSDNTMKIWSKSSGSWGVESSINCPGPVKCLQVIAADHVLLAVNSRGICRYNLSEGDEVREVMDASGTIECMQVARNGTVYWGSYHLGISRPDGEEYEPAIKYAIKGVDNTMESAKILCMHVLPDGRIITGHRNRIVVWDGEDA